ncbi:MAG: ribosome rescue protein RqcH [Nitrosopumilaceae archaeon]
MTLAGIELNYLVKKITKEVQGYYVSNIWGITKDSILFKLHHPEKSDVFMVISTSGVWLTSVKIDPIEPNRLLKRLRSDLLRFKIKKIEQIGSERIAYFTFEGFGKEFVIIGEFFGDGNILLCNEDMKILALQHSIDVRHRKLGVGMNYATPPQSGLDIFNIRESDFEDLKISDLIAGKWLGRTLGLPKKYVEGIFEIAKVDPKKVGKSFSHDEIQNILHATKTIVSNVITGNHDPIIIKNDKTEVIPIKLGQINKNFSSVNSFMEGLDNVFTDSIVEKGRAAQTSDSDKKIKDLETQISEQEKAIETVKEKSNFITNLANSLYVMVSKGILSIEDENAKSILEENKAQLSTEKGVSLIVIRDEKIKINPQASLQSIASVLFNEAKRQSGAIESIEKIKNKTKKKLEKLKNKSESEIKEILVSEVRKKNWYERYRWFFTSDDMLAIGGRDAPSNSAIVRKHLGKNDKIFHADVFGSPFFILKDAESPSSISMNEVAHATVCFSRGWREGMHGLNAYWVYPDQVKKSAPSGQFLPKGSFTIEGKRNYVNIPSLRLAIGIIPQDENYLLTSGPLEPIKKNSICYAVIEPHGSEMVEIAKKIKLEFSKLEEEITKQISIDDFVRALPAGKSQIKKISFGDVT